MYTSSITSLENVKDYFPDITYKYRDWNDPYHKTILTNQQVYFAPPSSFWKMGDPYDCRFPVEFDFSFEANRIALERGYPYDTSGMSRRDLEFELRRQHHINAGTEEAKRKFMERYYTSSSHHLGVLSITGRNNNLKIWQSKYAVHFHGFCVGINFRECIQELADNHIGGGNIMYVTSETPPIKHISVFTHSQDEVIGLHLKLIHTKYETFSFEEEYRLTKRFYQHPILGPTAQADRLFTVPKHCFKSVTFGYKMPDRDRQEIVQVCADQNLTVDFYVASPAIDGSETVSLEPYL